LRARRTGVVICGANIDSDSFYRYLKRGEAALQAVAPVPSPSV
jgi:hypothetical protein